MLYLCQCASCIVLYCCFVCVAFCGVCNPVDSPKVVEFVAVVVSQYRPYGCHVEEKKTECLTVTENGVQA